METLLWIPSSGCSTQGPSVSCGLKSAQQADHSLVSMHCGEHTQYHSKVAAPTTVHANFLNTVILNKVDRQEGAPVQCGYDRNVQILFEVVFDLL